MRRDLPEHLEAGRDGEAATWSVRLSEGPLDAEAQRQFQDWLDADPGNAAALEEITDVWRAVERHGADPEMLRLRQQALASGRRASHERIRGAGPWPASWMAAAAALVLCLLIGGGLAVWTPRTYSTGLGERRLVALSDGSKVSLDADTAVGVRYAFGRRQLWLRRGRARFDVAKDPLRPFTVAAGDREVVATGTSFSVELVRNQVRVILYQGHVAVLDIGRAPSAARKTASPTGLAPTVGQELITAARDRAAAAPPVVSQVDPVRTLSWEGGQLVFEDEPLSTAVERMNRYAHEPLLLGDATIGRIRISGVFPADDTEAFVQGVTAAFPVRARREDGRILLSSAASGGNLRPAGSANPGSHVTP